MFKKIFIAATLVTSSIAMAYDRDASIAFYEQQVGLQRKIVVEEKAALDHAIDTRDNTVHLTRDFIYTVAAGVSSGVMTYDFIKGTNNLEAVRNLFVSKQLAQIAPRRRGRVSAAQRALETDAAEATAAGAVDRAAMFRKISLTAYRTTEAVSAAVLGVFFVGDLYQTGNDVAIKFTDTKEIAEHRRNLTMAERNLRIADQNLQTAALANQF